MRSIAKQLISGVFFFVNALMAAEVHVQITPCGPFDEAPTYVAVTKGESPMTSDLETYTYEPGQYEFLVDVSPPGVATLYVANAAFWVRQGIPLDARDETVRIPAWPLGSVTGRLSVPRGEDLPPELMVRLSRVEGTMGQKGESKEECRLEMAWAECEVDREEDPGAFRCPMPIGPWHLRFKAPGWAAKHLWDQKVGAESALDVGTLALRRGATLIGEVETIDGPANALVTRIYLETVGAELDAERADLAQRQFRLQTRINDYGHFVFEDLRPGRYALVAHQPGYSPRRVYPVDVVENHETSLREVVVLGPLVTLEGKVTPAAHPVSGPWEVRVYRDHLVRDSRELIAKVAVGEGGEYEIPHLESDSYVVEVTDAKGSVWLQEGPVLADLEETIYLPLEVDTELVEVHGSVSLGDTELPRATLWFGGRFGETSIDVAADEEGTFQVYLPRSGDWEVDVEASEPPVNYTAYVLDVPESGEVEIRLPSTVLYGIVMTEEGDPPPSPARVHLAKMDQVRSGVTIAASSSGDFEVRGLDPGAYGVEARADDLTSGIQTVNLIEDVEPPLLHLIVKGRKVVKGVVLSDHGGIPSAEVQAFPFGASGDPLQATVESAVTNPAGRFQLELPPGAARLLLSVYPPGFGLTVEAVDLRSSQVLEVRAAEAEGTLRLVRTVAGADDSGEEEQGAEVSSELVIVNGNPIGGIGIEQWAAMNGQTPSEGSLVVPAMPSGVYRYCKVTLPEALAVISGRAMPTNCSQGVLTPGGQLELRRPNL